MTRRVMLIPPLLSMSSPLVMHRTLSPHVLLNTSANIMHIFLSLSSQNNLVLPTYIL